MKKIYSCLFAANILFAAVFFGSCNTKPANTEQTVATDSTATKRVIRPLREGEAIAKINVSDEANGSAISEAHVTCDCFTIPGHMRLTSSTGDVKETDANSNSTRCVDHIAYVTKTGYISKQITISTTKFVGTVKLKAR